MHVDIGEQLVGAYFKVIESCDVVSYNVRPPGGKMLGLEELDVIGLRFADSTAFLAEVTTHIRGTLYRDNLETVRRIVRKHERQKAHAQSFLENFPRRHYSFWSPYVPVGAITKGIAEAAPELERVINSVYAQRIDLLRMEARRRTNEEGNDAFRLLQILEHLRPTH